MIFRIFNDETLRNEPPHRDAYRSGDEWRIEIDNIEDLEGLAGYGGRVSVVLECGENHIRLTPLETRLHEARRKVEARANAHPSSRRGAVRCGDGDRPSGL